MPYDSRDAMDNEQPGGATPPSGYGGAPQGQQDSARESAYSQLRAAYKRILKRDPDDSELESHLQGRYDSASVQRAIQAVQTSPEALQVATANQPGGQGSSTTPGERGPAVPGSTTGGGMSREQRDTLKWGDVGKMEGFQVGSDYGGDTKARNSVKNTFGRIASRYPATPEGVRMVMQDPDFKRAFPNARLIDHPTGDKIDFGGVKSDFESGSPVGVVDVGRAFSGAGQTEQTGWQWLTDDTSSSAYQRTQNAILNPNDPRLQGGISQNVTDAILGGGPNALAQYIQYLQSLQQAYQQGSQPTAPPSPYSF